MVRFSYCYHLFIILVLLGCTQKSTQEHVPLIDFGFDPQTQGVPGTESTQWIVKILINLGGNRKNFCTGSVIKDNLILTAGHCLKDRKNGSLSPEQITIEFTDRVKNQKYHVPIKRSSVHPNYISDLSLSTPKKFDFGLIELENPVDPRLTGKLPHVVLNKRQLDFHGIPSRPFLFFGYGFTKIKENAGRLLYGQAISHSPQQCFDAFLKSATEGQSHTPCVSLNYTNYVHFFCSLTGARSAATQPGDSGGPAIVVWENRQYLVGVSTSGSDQMAADYAKNSLFETLDHPSVHRWMSEFMRGVSQNCDSTGCTIQ